MRYATFVFTLIVTASTFAAERVNVRLVTDKAEAVLAILDTRARGEAIDEKAWTRLFATEGDVRLEAREEAMKR